MLIQLALGTGMICFAVLLQSVFVYSAFKALQLRRYSGTRSSHRALMLTLATLWLIVGQTATVWVWAVLFLLLGAFDTVETSVYFSLVAFTTLGFGDVLIGPDWRLLGGLTATNGMIAFGLTTAALLEVMERLRRTPPGGP